MGREQRKQNAHRWATLRQDEISVNSRSFRLHSKLGKCVRKRIAVTIPKSAKFPTPQSELWGGKLRVFFIVRPTSENGLYTSDIHLEGFWYCHALALLKRLIIFRQKNSLKGKDPFWKRPPPRKCFI